MRGGPGNLVLAVQGKSCLDLGPLNAAGGYDLFLARFTPDREHLWSKRFLFLVRFAADGGHALSKAFKTGSYAYPQAVAFDAAGNLLLGGYSFVSLDMARPSPRRCGPRSGPAIFSCLMTCGANRSGPGDSASR